jgi:hypothetical protein
VKYSTTYQLYGSLDEVLDAVKNREYNADPNVRSIKKICWKETDTEINCEYHVQGHGDIPEVVRHLITPKMVTWREVGHWDKPRNYFEYKVTPFYFANTFRMRGAFKFKPLANDRIECHLDAEIHVGIPMFGDYIERTVVKRQLETIHRQTEFFNKRILENQRKSG